jgi:hypothetical protein
LSAAFRVMLAHGFVRFDEESGRYEAVLREH